MTEVRSNDYRSAAVRVTEFTLGTKHTNQNVSTTSFTQRPFQQKWGSWEAHGGGRVGGSWEAHGRLRTTLRTTSDHYNPTQFISCIPITAIVHSFRIHYAETYSTSLTVSELPPTMVRFTCHAFDAGPNASCVVTGNGSIHVMINGGSIRLFYGTYQRLYFFTL